jgi:peptide/nickel transport system substrate-binding protein
VLKRNRFYRGRKPANPDEIDFNIGISYGLQQLRCEQDDADVCGFPPGNAAELRKKYDVNRGRFFVKRHRTLYFLSINRDQDLFRDNDRLARAVNLALDRAAILRLNGALGGIATDQLLPRGVRGFRDWRLYPLKGALSKARRLARGHLGDGKCQLWSFNDGLGPGVAETIQLELEKIGIDCDTTLLARTDLYRQAGTRGAGYDLLLNSWDAQYPDPFDYFRLLDGRQIRARNNENLSYFEDARVNRLLAAAAEKAGRARSRAYAKLDRELMSRYAPVAPLFVSENTRVLVSSRVGCFASNEIYGVDYGALCLDQQSAKDRRR